MGKPVILFIEDDADLGRAYERVLQDEFPEYTVLTQTTAYDAANDATLNKNIVAIITDNNLPRSTEEREVRPRALHLCRHFRRTDHLKNIPIFVLSNDVSRADREILKKIDVSVMKNKDPRCLHELIDDLKNIFAGTKKKEAERA